MTFTWTLVRHSQTVLLELTHSTLTAIMPGDETLQKHAEDSGSESEDEEEAIPHVEVDATKLTPLSPEVISKQVKQLS